MEMECVYSLKAPSALCAAAAAAWCVVRRTAAAAAWCTAAVASAALRLLLRATAAKTFGWFVM